MALAKLVALSVPRTVCGMQVLNAQRQMAIANLPRGKLGGMRLNGRQLLFWADRHVSSSGLGRYELLSGRLPHRPRERLTLYTGDTP